MRDCCDPCPVCGSPVDVDEIPTDDGDDWYWYHWCSSDTCNWNDDKGRS